MDPFTFDWSRSWLARMFGRNELIRGSDRLESIGLALAAIAVILAVPVAAAFGTWVKDHRSSVYVAESQSRHQSTATALEDATMHVQAYSQTLAVSARWSADGQLHVATLTPPHWVRAGEHFAIWIDESGNDVKAPTPLSQAAADALVSATLLWLTVAWALTGAVYLLRRKLNQNRYREWDRELDSLAGNGGGRASH